MLENPYSFEKVLLVDDNTVCNFLNRQVLELTLFSRYIVETINGIEAIKYLESAASDPDQIPELIFLDIYMPLLDGLGFLEKFNKLPKCILSKSRILVLSSTLDPSDINKVYESPYVIKFIEKTLTRQKIFETDLKGIHKEYLSFLEDSDVAA